MMVKVQLLLLWLISSFCVEWVLKDVVVQARTGTGKTAAFGLPTVDRLVDLSQKRPQVLVLSPTRELALQINRELENLSKYKGVSCTAVYGGAAMQPQRSLPGLPFRPISSHPEPAQSPALSMSCA